MNDKNLIAAGPGKYILLDEAAVQRNAERRVGRAAHVYTVYVVENDKVVDVRTALSVVCEDECFLQYSPKKPLFKWGRLAPTAALYTNGDVALQTTVDEADQALTFQSMDYAPSAPKTKAAKPAKPAKAGSTTVKKDTNTNG